MLSLPSSRVSADRNVSVTGTLAATTSLLIFSRFRGITDTITLPT